MLKGELMYNYYFFDLDGTLVEKGSNIISENNYKILQKIKSRGHKIIINTGRDLKRAFAIKNLDKIADYVIASLGSIISDNKGNILKIYPISKEKCFEVLKELKYKAVIGYGTKDGEKIINSGKIQLYYDNCKAENRDIGKIVDVYEFLNDAELGRVLNFYFYVNNPKTFYCNINDLNLFSSYNNGIDVTYKNIDKGYPIEEYFSNHKEYYYFYAIGDGENDIPMFNICDTSISFVDSNIKAREKAKIISPIASNNDGITYIFENILKEW